MLFRIPSGKHNSKPFRFWAWFNKRSFDWKVNFGTNCAYDLQGVDQADTNKLCGVGYLSKLRFIKAGWFWKPEPMQWTDSARFGWRYDIGRQQVELMAYCHVNRTRVIKSICFCDPGKTYRLHLDVFGGIYAFSVSEDGIANIGTAYITSRNFKKFTYMLGVFFGGNQPAPHTMYINLTRL